MNAPIADNETERLAKLKDYGILDTDKEDIFEEITISAAAICGAKIAAISLIDKDRQWFKSIQGVDIFETPRDQSYCAHTILNDKMLVVEDSEANKRFFDDHVFLGEKKVRFYAGAPLITPDGFRIGTLCVIDSEKKTLNDSQKKVLISLSKQVINYLELKLYNNKLKLVEKRFEEVQEISKTGHWELDLKTNLVAWSKEVYKIYDIEESREVCKDDGISYYTKEDQIRLQNMIEASIEERKGFAGDFSLIDSKGNHKWVRSAGHPILNEKQEVIKLVGTFQDITAIKDASKREKDIFEQSFDSIMTLEPPHWNFTSANPAAIKLFNTEDEAKFLKLGPWDISPSYQPGGRLSSEMAKEYIEEAMSNGSSLFEWQHCDLNGEPIDCTVLLSKVTINNKSFLQSTVRDVSDIKAHERDNKYILETMKVGTWKWDIVKNHLVWNESNYNVFNLDKEDFNSAYEAWEKTIHPDFKDEVVKDLEEAIEKFDEYNATFPILLKNNEIRYIAAKAEIIRNENGDAVKMMGVNWDTTKVYKMAQDLEKEKKRSYHSAKLASIGELAAGVGHEINNPMAIISGHCSIILRLMKQGKVDQIPKSINIMNNAVTRVTNIVRGLKTFSRTDSIESEHFNFSSLVLETTEMVKDIYRKDGIEIITDLIDDCVVWGNRGRLQQVIVNLMSNAKDALQMSECKIINISIKESKDSYIVSVSDSGQGIPRNIIDKIFDPFYTSKDVNKGTGIGLSLCYRIMSEHDSELTVKSEEGKGATFEFDFKKVLGSAQVDLKTNKSLLEESDRKKMSGHVLIVDDEIEVQKLLQLFINDIGLTCDCANNGKEALELYLKSSDKYDYIISDMQMPVMDGKSLFKEIKSRKDLKQPKLVIVTGGVNINFEDKDSAVGKLIDGYFCKPFNMELILETLKNL